MKTLRELATFMQAAAAKREASYVPSSMEVLGGYSLGITEAAQAVAAEHGADVIDVAFVGAVLFACWNDALEWAEARREAAVDGHRHFYYWCSNCATRLHVETAEQADDSRGVEDHPDAVKCPMCGYAFMEDWDEIAAYDESFRNHGTWEDFERWRAKRRGAP